MKNHTRHRIAAEIEYIDENLETRHSDIGPRAASLDYAHAEYRQFLHDNLDEWLDKSDGTGIFYITGDAKQYLKACAEERDLGADSLTAFAAEKRLERRIENLELQIGQLKRQLTSNARDHGAGGYWQKN